MTTNIQFNARFYNTQKRIRAISGRLGLFIFRTSKSGQISCYYKPRKHDPLPNHSRTVFESLSNQLRDIALDLGLYITSVNYQFLEL